MIYLNINEIERLAELVKLDMCVIAELKGTKWSIEVTK